MFLESDAAKVTNLVDASRIQYAWPKGAGQNVSAALGHLGAAGPVINGPMYLESQWPRIMGYVQ